MSTAPTAATVTSGVAARGDDGFRPSVLAACLQDGKGHSHGDQDCTLRATEGATQQKDGRDEPGSQQKRPVQRRSYVGTAIGVRSAIKPRLKRRK